MAMETYEETVKYVEAEAAKEFVDHALKLEGEGRWLTSRCSSLVVNIRSGRHASTTRSAILMPARCTRNGALGCCGLPRR